MTSESRKRHWLFALGQSALLVSFSCVASAQAPAPACPDPWPGWPAFCPSQVADEIDAATGTHHGTDQVPTPPTLPSGPVRTWSGTAADTTAEVSTAMQAPGWSQIVLGADIGTISVHANGVGARDVTIYLNGHRIDRIVFGHQAGNAARIVFIGGRIGAVLGLGRQGRLDDVVFHGVWIGPDFLSSPGGQTAIDVGNSGQACARWSFSSTIARGYSGAHQSTNVLLGGCEDLVVLNSNWRAGSAATGNRDDWVWRSTGGFRRHWAVDSYFECFTKACMRGAVGTSQVSYTTRSCMGQPCAMTMVNRRNGNLDPAQGDGGAIDRDVTLRIRNRWYLGNSSGTGVGLWGPYSVADYWYMGGTSICSESAAFFDMRKLTSREAGAGGSTWRLDETYNGVATTVRHASPISACPIPAWPTRGVQSLPGIPSSALGNVGADPMASPPH